MKHKLIKLAPDLIALFIANGIVLWLWFRAAEIYEFATPVFLWGLFIVPLLGIWLIYKKYKEHATVKLSSYGFIPKPDFALSKYLTALINAMILVAVGIFFIVLSRPQTSRSWENISTEGIDIVITMDISASMLDETIVNIIRLRNMKDERKQAAEKWKRAQGTAEWLISNLPPTSRFQVYLFNTRARSAMAGKQGKWLDASQPEEISAVVKGLREAIPAGGTSLFHAFEAANSLQPRPDNILLVTDGLPTQGSKKPTSTTVSSDERLKLFKRAVKRLPASVPVNTILLPMEGDAYAAAAFWQLAVRTQGSFLTPARDWP